MTTLFKGFATLCEALRGESGRNEKKKLIAKFLLGLEAGEVEPAVSFLTGRPLGESDGRRLELGGSALWRLGSSKQLTLVTDPLTIEEVAKTFDAVAEARGSGSRAKKELLVKGLLARADDVETGYLLRILGGEMRIGAVEGVVMDAIAEASGADLALVQRANMLAGNLGQVAKIALVEGEGSLRGVGLHLFTPIKPMLADMAGDIGEVFQEHKGGTALEWKFDGARLQIHKKGSDVRIFSRRLSDVTGSLPDVVDLVKDEIRVESALVEGEGVAVGTGGRPLPFQDLMRRFQRVRRIEEMAAKIPLRLYLFDLLYLDGVLLVDKPYKRRWELLSSIAPSHLLAPRLVTDRSEEAEAFLRSALEAGHEGLMAKALDSSYTPGIRGKRWLKIKPFETLDLVIVAAEWGYGRREGWLSNYHLAARDEEGGGFAMLGKTFKGLTDWEFEAMTRRLQQIKVSEDSHTVYVEPKVVVEVAYNELQRSPRYSSGLALRFARILRLREDKGPDDVDTLTRARELYSRQFRAKARFSPDHP